jgi:glucokinase
MPVLGIDIGGTKTIVAVADDAGRIIAQRRITMPGDRAPAAVLFMIEFALNALMQQSGIALRDVEAIGIGCGGPLDRERGTILTAPNLPGWENLPLVDHFRKAFESPVYLDNDVTLAALGEAKEGAGAGVDHFAYFNIGTGIGGGIIIDGKVYRGCGNAGEFGHQVIVPDGPPCPCGKHGCLESLASGTSIARIARERVTLCPDSLILRLAGDGESVTAERVARAARQKDPLAVNIMSETGGYLGLGVANVVSILNPRMVILGGGVIAGAGDLLLDGIRKTVRERAMTQLADDVEIIPAALGDQAGIIGAIHLALDSSGRC